MGIAKFITMFDDPCNIVTGKSIREKYDISALPVQYFFRGKPFYDGVNSDWKTFDSCKDELNSKDLPSVPVKVLRHMYEYAYEVGYLAVFVICPHSGLFNFYSNAVTAKNKLLRSGIDSRDFNIHIIKSRSFSSGMLLQTIDVAKLIKFEHCPTAVAAELEKQKCKKAKTFVIMPDRIKCSADKYKIMLIENSVTVLPAVGSQSSIFDSISEMASSAIIKSGGKYSVSLGGNCSFAGNVIGRIESLTGITPVCTSMYGTPSANVFGNEAICIHIV